MNAARKSHSRYSFHSFSTALAICLAVSDSQLAFISSRCRSIFLIRRAEPTCTFAVSRPMLRSRLNSSRFFGQSEMEIGFESGERRRISHPSMTL
jgi:hypothetical protein